MSKNVKQNNKLNAQQAQTLALLLAGKTQRETAAALDIAEETISRWKHNDAAFIAAYNEGCQALYDASLVEMLELRRAAVKAIKEAVDDDQPRHADRRLKAAIAALKMPAPTIGDTDPKDIALGLSKKDRDRERAEMFTFG
jgi:hypothetical protein